MLRVYTTHFGGLACNSVDIAAGDLINFALMHLHGPGKTFN